MPKAFAQLIGLGLIFMLFGCDNNEPPVALGTLERDRIGKTPRSCPTTSMH